jgi:hypothetical protein
MNQVEISRQLNREADVFRDGLISWLENLIPPGDLTWNNPISRELLIARMTLVMGRTFEMEMAGVINSEERADILRAALFEYLNKQAEGRLAQLTIDRRN